MHTDATALRSYGCLNVAMLSSSSAAFPLYCVSPQGPEGKPGSPGSSLVRADVLHTCCGSVHISVSNVCVMFCREVLEEMDLTVHPGNQERRLYKLVFTQNMNFKLHRLEFQSLLKICFLTTAG